MSNCSSKTLVVHDLIAQVSKYASKAYKNKACRLFISGSISKIVFIIPILNIIQFSMKY
jgi:hypothetical protein